VNWLPALHWAAISSVRQLDEHREGVWAFSLRVMGLRFRAAWSLGTGPWELTAAWQRDHHG